jgi:hypothetical protein
VYQCLKCSILYVKRLSSLTIESASADTGQMDLLQDHLARARASGGVFARTVTAPPWGLRLPGTIQLALHAVVQGRAWLWLDDPQTVVELAPGELALVRGGPRPPHRPRACGALP